MKDWQIRAIKTFIQAFGGVLIPEIVLMLNGTLPDTWEAFEVIAIPALCAALAAGIAAAWNAILEHMKGNN